MWRRRSVSVVVTASAAIVMTSLAGCSGSAELPVTARTLPFVPQRRILRSVVNLGRSTRGRPIRAIVLGDPNAARPVLVVGCIHGNETAGIAVADRLAAGPPPSGSAIWIIRDLNPDGVAAGTRQNAHHVDLNRNFPFGWRPLGHPGDQQYAGPRTLSEPESRLARTLILRLRPRITIWFHQPLDITDRSGGDVRIEARFAALSRLPLTRLRRYPGSVATWENHQRWGGTAFVVELPPAHPRESAMARYADAVRQLANEFN
jgi:murein peptide amidase A